MKIKTAFAAALLFLAGCVTSPKSYDLPPEVVQWSQDNVYLVNADKGTGSGFWYDNETFLTACHVVSYSWMSYTWDETNKKMIKKDHFEVDVEAIIHSYDNKDNYHMAVISCDKEKDIAILKPWSKWSNKKKTKIAPIPKQGKAVWGPGYPLAMRLTITEGHWQSKDAGPYDYLVTSPTIFGDSGSPVVSFVDGEIQIVGMRQAIRGERGMGMYTHLALVAAGPTLLEHLDQYNERLE